MFTNHTKSTAINPTKVILFKGYKLDEPTASLDPNSEYEIYMQFHDIFKDQCAVLFTHRLFAVQLVDKVAVFKDCHVAEYGTHADLYAMGGIYTEMFDKQARFYRDVPQNLRMMRIIQL